MGPQLWGIPRETFLIKKGLIKLVMDTKEKMVSANHRMEMVGPSSLAMQLLDIRWLRLISWDFFFAAVYSLIQIAYWNKQKLGTAFLGIKFIRNDIYSNLMMSLVLTYSQWTPRLFLHFAMLWACRGWKAASIFETLVIAHSSDRMSDSSTVFSTVLWDKD